MLIVDLNIVPTWMFTSELSMITEQPTMNCNFEGPTESESKNDTCKLSSVRLFPNYEKWKIVSSVGGQARIDHTLQSEGRANTDWSKTIDFRYIAANKNRNKKQTIYMPSGHFPETTTNTHGLHIAPRFLASLIYT